MGEYVSNQNIEESRRESERSARRDNLVGWVCVFVAYGFMFSLPFWIESTPGMRAERARYERAVQVRDSLRAYIEKEDGEPGVSFKDRIAFYQRVEFPTRRVDEQGRMDLWAMDDTLCERVLREYRNEKLLRSW